MKKITFQVTIDFLDTVQKKEVPMIAQNVMRALVDEVNRGEGIAVDENITVAIQVEGEGASLNEQIYSGIDLQSSAWDVVENKLTPEQ